MPQSFILGGVSCYVRQFAKPKIVPAIDWVRDSAQNMRGSDRGVAQDVYEVDVVFFDVEATLNTLAMTLDSNREGVTLSSFSTDIFTPNVDHSGSISCTIARLGQRRQVSYAAPSRMLYELPATLRAISPTVLTSPAASLATLKLQDGFSPDKTYGSRSGFSYTQVAAYTDARDDVGLFRGRFRQTKAQAQAILRYLLVTARASTVTFPTLGGVTYPFGVVRGALPKNCKIVEFAISRVNHVFYDLEIEFAEVG